MSTEKFIYDCPECGHEMGLIVAYEPPDPNYGADRDGNRGVFLPGRWVVEDTEPCVNGCEITPEDLDCLAELVQDDAEDLEQALADAAADAMYDDYIDRRLSGDDFWR
jgi:hypothetical protein